MGGGGKGAACPSSPKRGRGASVWVGACTLLPMRGVQVGRRTSSCAQCWGEVTYCRKTRTPRMGCDVQAPTLLPPDPRRAGWAAAGDFSPG